MKTLIYRGYAGRTKKGKRSIPVEVYFDHEQEAFNLTLMSEAPKKPFNIGGVRVNVDTDVIQLDIPEEVRNMLDSK